MNVAFDYIRKGLFSLACCFAVLFPSGAALASEAGRVIALTPGAYAERLGQRVPLEMKSPVFESDTIVTDATGKVQIFFADDGSVTLGPDTALALREVVPEGDGASFKAHLGQGVARFLTGRIVEANPGGFAVSTPEGTAGIRGTIFVLQTGNGRSTLFVVNASRDVVLNGVSVPGAHKMTIPGGLPTPMTPADLQQAQSLAAARPPASRASGADSGRVAGLGLSSPVENVADNGAALTPTTLSDLGLGTQALGDAVSMANVPHATVSGMCTSTIWADGIPFEFKVALQNGNIFNGRVNGSTSFVTVNLYNGSGMYNAGTGSFNVSNFNGNYYVPAGSPLIAIFALVPSPGTYDMANPDHRAELNGSLADLNSGTSITGSFPIDKGFHLHNGLAVQNSGIIGQVQ
ncbi:MAG: FecR domain-containing protein [Desulfovibrio sp.]|jgi:hypothetical protein|nr:FecR domain-containing protein [Desulfovibrio sp.]